MFDIKGLLILIPAMPLVAAIATAVLGPRMLRARSHLLTVAAIGISFLAAVALLIQVNHGADDVDPASGRVGYEKVVHLWTWATVDDAYQPQTNPDQRANQRAAGFIPALSRIESAGVNPAARADAAAVPFRISVTLRADPLTAVMLVTVTLVSLLVAVYSIGYMHDDRGYWRFFSYIALFVFSMTMLVSVSNFVLLYVFWEAVGLCSYLLIGFWYQKPEASAAGKKAFLVNRVGDFGFALGVFLLWTTFGTLDFHDTYLQNGSVRILETAGIFGQSMLSQPAQYLAHGPTVLTAICLLLMLGACGKSAQFPLHVWLPDAMEGPTPVSALIHAATMVTAGVYMVARCMPLFAASVTAQQVVAVIGGFTALMAALVALTQTDLKRILAYSTISQLGYMFLALGAGTLAGATAGMFHLVTHAFFKALLFLGAGSVMHAMGGVIDVRRFGGLRRIMPWTHATFLVGCLALAGLFPFAGYWSKDSILEAVAQQPGRLYQVLGFLGMATAGLTAFYTFRAFFLTFYGKEKIPHEAGHHAHESPASMVLPLVVLAAASLVVGAHLGLTHSLEHFLAKAPSLAVASLPQHGPHAEEEAAWVIPVTSSVVVLVGILLAWFLYLGRESLLATLSRIMEATGLYRLSHDKFYFDEIYNVLVVWPLQAISRGCYLIDRYVIDGAVNALGFVPVVLGGAMRSLQGGLVPFYALAMVLGLLVLLGALMM